MVHALVHCMCDVLASRLRCIQCFMVAAKSVRLDLGECVLRSTELQYVV